MLLLLVESAYGDERLSPLPLDALEETVCVRRHQPLRLKRFFLLSPHAQNLFTMLPPREVHEHQQEQKHHKQDAADPGLHGPGVELVGEQEENAKREVFRRRGEMMPRYRDG